MSFLGEKRRVNAIVKKSIGKMVKVKQGPDSDVRQVIRQTIDIPITKGVKETLPPWAVAMLSRGQNEAATEDTLAFNSASVGMETKITANFYSRANFKPDAQPVLTRGAKAWIKKIFSKDAKDFLQIELQFSFDTEAWTWCGKWLGDAEIVLETIPLEGKLDFEKADAEKDAPKAEEKPEVTGSSEIFEGVKEVADEGPQGDDVRPQKLKDKEAKRNEAANAAPSAKPAGFTRKVGDPATSFKPVAAQ